MPYLSPHTGSQVDDAVSVIRYSGVVDIANNAPGGTVTGLGLGFTPSKMLLVVQVPSGGYALSACVVGDPTADGFEYYLTPGSTASTGTYKLYYFPVP